MFPQAVQEAYIVSESLLVNKLERLIGMIGSESQDEVNVLIRITVREQTKQTRKGLL